MIYITTYPKGSTIMRKLLLTTAAVAAAIAGVVAVGTLYLSERGNRLIFESMLPIIYGTFNDSRDGQTYRTITIGGQTWMAQNLNYVANSSWCYDDSADNCKIYGRLYDWKTATTACPAGWKLPDRSDWNRLVATMGGKNTAGKKLKSTSGWNDYMGKSGNATINYGFSALPGGYRNSYGNFGEAGYHGSWWTATERRGVVGSFTAYYRDMNYISGDVAENDIDKAESAYSVRCVADK